MQGPSLYPQMNPQFPEHERLKCPRCDSDNTKFCYYNNYNLSQPRHYCKSCRRYWTKGGALRNIPVGGGSRKSARRSGSGSKRTLSSCPSSPSSSNTTNQKVPKSESLAGCPLVDHHRRSLDASGGFSSLLAGNGQFRSLIEGFNSNGFGKSPTLSLDPGSQPNMIIRNPFVESQGATSKTESCLGAGNGGDSSCYTGSNGWPDLAIYTPGSTFQ